MTDENSSPPAGPGGRRKRPPTVLDLEATDVTPETAAPEPPPAEAPAAAADAPPAPPPETAAPGASAEPPLPPPPRSEEPPGPRTSWGWLPEGASWIHVGAGIAGAVGGLGVFLLLWLGGALPGVRDTSADVGPQLAAIQKQLKELSGRPASASIDPKALDAIAARLAKIEVAQSVPSGPATDPAMANRLGAMESAVKSLAGNVAALSNRADGEDGAVREANARIEKLTAALGELQTALRTAQAGSDRASRLAVATAALRNAVERGEPFAAELAIVKPLAPDASEITVLEPFAQSGVPSDAVLGRELAALVQPMLQRPPSEPSGGGFLDRLQANAEKLVRVTPVGEARADGRGAVLSRIGQRAEQGDVAGALAEFGKLPPDARAPFQPWIDKAQARGKAIDAGRRLAAGAIAALKPAP
jgi:hypothetical protein